MRTGKSNPKQITACWLPREQGKKIQHRKRAARRNSSVAKEQRGGIRASPKSSEARIECRQRAARQESSVAKEQRGKSQASGKERDLVINFYSPQENLRSHQQEDCRIFFNHRTALKSNEESSFNTMSQWNYLDTQTRSKCVWSGYNEERNNNQKPVLIWNQHLAVNQVVDDR